MKIFSIPLNPKLSEQEFKDMLKIIVNDATNIKPFVEEKKEDTIN